MKKIDKLNNVVFYTQSYPFFHKLIKNKYNEIISSYDNNRYVLMHVKIENDRKIDFQDLQLLFSLNINHNGINLKQKNYYVIWNKKIEYFEKYYGNEDYIVNYIVGISMNAIQYCKKINYNNITYGFSFNRFYKTMRLIKFWDPTNLDYCPIVNGIAEYIKELFFFYDEQIDINYLFDFNLTIDDCYLLISRILFPTYLFDNYNIKVEYLISKMDNFIKYIDNIIFEIKKRYKDVSIIKWLND